MSNENQTPITKFLVDFGKRQTVIASRLRGNLSSRRDTPTPFLQPRPTTSTGHHGHGHGGAGINLGRLNFEDSFLDNVDKSMLHISPDAAPTYCSPSKKRRLLFANDEDEEIDKLKRKADEYQRLLQNSQTALIESRSLATKLQVQGNETKLSYKEKLIEFEKSTLESNGKCRELTLKVETLEEQLKKSQNNEKEALDKLHKQQEEHIEKVAAIEKKNRNILIDSYDLKKKYDEIKFESDERLRKVSNELSDTERGADKWIIDCQLLKDQQILLQNQLSKTQNDLKEAQILLVKYQEYKNKLESETPPEIEAENEKIKVLENKYLQLKLENHKLLDKNRQLTDENEKMRSKGRSDLTLEEKLNYLERNNCKLKDQLKDKVQIEEEKKVLENTLRTWIESAKKFDDTCSTPMDFECYLRKNQNLLFELKHENTNQRIKADSLFKDVNKLSEQKKLSDDSIKKLTEEKEKLEKIVKLLKRKLSLMTKNRDSLQDVIRSYEQEFTGLLTPPLQGRNVQLEELITEYERLLHDEELGFKTCDNCTKLNTTLEELRREHEEFKKIEETLNETLALAGGDQNVSADGTKIVSFGLNPSRMSIEARIKELVQENGKLKGKISDLEDLTTKMAYPGSTSGAVGVVGDKGIASEEYKSLQRRHDLLTEAYNFETGQLTVACYKLFGFHVTLVREPQNQIRLQSVYSNCPQDIFIFQEADNGDMMLLESTILDQFRGDIENFLIREGSIPAFLASVSVAYVQNLVQPSISQEESESQSNLEIQTSYSQAQSLPPTTTTTQQHHHQQQQQLGQGSSSSTSSSRGRRGGSGGFKPKTRKEIEERIRAQQVLQQQEHEDSSESSSEESDGDGQVDEGDGADMDIADYEGSSDGEGEGFDQQGHEDDDDQEAGSEIDEEGDEEEEGDDPEDQQEPDDQESDSDSDIVELSD